MIAGYPIDTIYLYVLIGCTVISFFLFIFGDIFDFDGPVDPMLIIPWLAFTSLFGIMGEKIFDMGHLLVFLVSGGLSLIIVFLMNFYILIPLRNSESSLSVSEKDFEGRTATVITPIPVKGMGEIKLSSVTGTITRPAAFYEAQEEGVKAGSEVLIIEIKDRVCYVVPYKENFI
mgnify:CR=1 FL=1